MNQDAIIYFDGLCNLCNSFVRFVIKNDKKGFFRFASLQSPSGAVILNQLDDPTIGETVILRLNGKLYTKSAAAMMIIKHLDSPVKLLYGFIIVPRIIRDWVYNLVAVKRYKWFGKTTSCMVPDTKIRNRFIDL